MDATIDAVAPVDILTTALEITHSDSIEIHCFATRVLLESM